MNLYEVAKRRQLKVISSIDGNLEEILKYNRIVFITKDSGEKAMGYDRKTNIFVVSDNYMLSKLKFQEAINKLKEISLDITIRKTSMTIEIIDGVK